MICWDALWRLDGYNYKVRTFFQDDFMSGGTSSGTIGQLGWASAGTVSVRNGESNEPGIYRIDTGAVQATAARINTTTAFSAGQPHRVTWIIRLGQTDANTTTRFGAGVSVTGTPPNDGIYFDKTDSDTNWQCVTRASSSETRTDSGVATSTNFVKLEYVRSTTDVKFYINGTLVATHTATIPSSVIPAVFAYIINSTAASKTADIGYCEFKMTGVAR